MDNGKNEKIVTKKITVVGIVQGIGFRPLVYHIAQKYGVFGTVRNLGGQAEIIIQSTEENIEDFLQELKINNNKDYEIVKMHIEDINEKEFEGFQIISSGSNNEIAVIPPDLPTCPRCRQELYTESDRRFKNPFISCMVCGPRYTIFEKLPYDRNNTTMKDFEMCPDCLNEYISPGSRRFHAQTISCNDCGPYLILDNLRDEEAFEKAVRIIKEGGIIAVKGIGGYHFACSPFIEETVENLRKLKGREEKPFAVMFDSLDSVKEYCILSEEEKILLESKARPIVLLPAGSKKMAPSTNKGSLYCGAFLPYTPLQIMLTNRCGPLVMTSGNISNRPIIKDDHEMLNLKSPYLNGVLYNTRRINRSVDDSVVKMIDRNMPQMIRRSRGYVPYPIFLPDIYGDKQIFAAGSDLKAAFCLYKRGNAVVSQYFGDLEEKAVLDQYTHSVEDLSDLLRITPDAAVCDMHPNYFSSRLANSLEIPVIYVQHHHAHIASVMAEHNLREKVIGVAFDGTGYGTDGNIWGGEFLICDGSEFRRTAHLSYTPLLGGDQSIRDARKTATCFLINAGLEDYIRDERSPIIKAAIKNNINTVLSSSMGRLFDAVASIIGIGDENTYEGECAINLEKAAVLALRNHLEPIKLSFDIIEKDDMINIDTENLLKEICRVKEDSDGGALALGFHCALSDAVLKVCEIIRERENINTVALSGGVFQNTILIERVLSILREKDFKVYINKAVPPNDGGISLGQAFIGLMR